MRTLQILTLAIALITLSASCQSTSAQMQGLSNKETRKEIMDAIANDSIMSQEMIGTMMNKKNAMMLMGNHSSMMNMLKDNPGMMQNMMSAMMETAKGDTSMMSGMIRTMIRNHQMMDMMHKMTDKNRMNDMHSMGGMSNDPH